MSEAQRNRPPISEETRKKMSVAQKGRVSPNKGKKWTEEHLRAVKEYMKDPRNNPNYGKGKHVIQLTLNGDLVAEYVSATEAQRITGISSSAIRSVCQHGPHYNTAGGYKWLYKEEYEENCNEE